MPAGLNYFSDHLRSTDLVTDALGTMSACSGNPSLITGEEESDYYPFGGERVLCDRGIGNSYKFTGKERDSETGLDEFGARYYSSFYGRFTIPDWAVAPTAVPYAKFGDPQSLNLYSYVENAPVNEADLDGHAKGDCTTCLEDGLQWIQQTAQNTEERIGNGAKALAAASQTFAQAEVDFFKTYSQEVNSNIPFSPISSPSPENGVERAAVAVGFASGFVVPEGEVAKGAKSALKIGKLTEEAEKLYPKLAGKINNHHVQPLYLKGPRSGPIAPLNAAYHQLITNAFRKLAPYGQAVERSAEQVKQIMIQVYRQYPLP